MKTPRDKLYYDNWQDFVHFRWLRSLLKQVPAITFDDLKNDTTEKISHTAVNDTKTGQKVYRQTVTYSAGNYPKHPGDNQDSEIKPCISDQLDYYWNKFTKPELDKLKDHVSALETENSQLKQRINNLENK